MSAYRSAIGSFGGSLKDIEIADLGAQVLETALANKTSLQTALMKLSSEMFFQQDKDKILHVKLLFVQAFLRQPLPMQSIKSVVPVSNQSSWLPSQSC